MEKNKIIVSTYIKYFNNLFNNKGFYIGLKNVGISTTKPKHIYGGG